MFFLALIPFVIPKNFNLNRPPYLPIFPRFLTNIRCRYFLWNIWIVYDQLELDWCLFDQNWAKTRPLNFQIFQILNASDRRTVHCCKCLQLSLLLLFDQIKHMIVMWNCCQCVQLSNNQGSQPLTRRETNCLFPIEIRPVQALVQTPQISLLFQRLYDFSKCDWNKWQKLLISSRIAKWANFSN